MENLKKRTVRGGVARLLGQATNFSLRFVYLVFMARLLEPGDFGLVAMVTVVTGFYDLFTSAGLSSATVQKVAVTDEQVSTLFWVNTAVGVTLCAICLGTAPALVAFYREPRLFPVTVALAIGFLFNAAGVQHIAMLQRELRYVTLTVIESVAQLSSVVVGIVLAVAGFGYWSLVVSSLAVPVTMTALAWMATKWLPGRPRKSAEIFAMLRFGGSLTLQSVLVHVSQNTDKVLLGRVWGAETLGIYGRGYQLVNMPMSSLSSAIGWVAFSALSRLQDDHHRYRSYFLKSYTLVISLIVPMLVFVAMFADETVAVVLGEKWGDVASVLRLLTPATLFLVITNPPTFWLLHSLGLAGRALKVSSVFTCLIIAACLAGLPHGFAGVALACSVASVVWLVPHLAWCAHGTPVRLGDLFTATWRPLLASVAASLIALLVVWQLAQPIARLAVGAFITGISYAGMLGLVLGQRSFYLDLLKDLKLASRAD